MDIPPRTRLNLSCWQSAAHHHHCCSIPSCPPFYHATGLQVLMLYLENTLEMSKAELSLFIAVLGILSIVAQTILLGFLAGRCVLTHMNCACSKDLLRLPESLHSVSFVSMNSLLLTSILHLIFLYSQHTHLLGFDAHLLFF